MKEFSSNDNDSSFEKIQIILKNSDLFETVRLYHSSSNYIERKYLHLTIALLFLGKADFE